MRVPTIVEALHREATALHFGLLRLQAHTNFTPDAQVEEARLLVVQLHLKVQQQWQLPTDGDPDDAAAYRCEACHRTFTSYRLLRAHEAKWHGKKTPQTLHPTFDRNAHGLNGLPTCRHCRHPFRQWDGLVKHIQRERCQVLRKPAFKVSDSTACAKTEQMTSLDARTTDDAEPSPPEGPPSPAVSHVADDSMEDASAHPLAPEAPCSSSTQVEPSVLPAEVSPADLPLMQWTNVKECLSNSQWTQLLQDDQVREYLQHRCPVCYQWLATTTSIKYHLTMTMQHPEWSAAQPAALKLLQGFRRRMVVPCRYCLQRQINKDRHWKQCHVLHICAFLAVHHGGDGQRPHGLGCSGAPVLDAGRTTEAGARREQVLCTGRARSDQEAEAGHAEQGQGQGQGSQREKQGLFKVGPTKPGCGSIEQFVAGGLHRWFRRADGRSLALHSDRSSGDGGRPGVDDSSHEHAGAAGVEAGANSILPSPGSSNLPLRPLRAGRDGAGTLRGCGQMENLEGDGTGQSNLLLEACHVQTAPDLVAPEIERNDQGQGSHGTGHLSQLGGREAALEAPQLEPGSATPGDRPKSPSDSPPRIC